MRSRWPPARGQVKVYSKAPSCPGFGSRRCHDVRPTPQSMPGTTVNANSASPVSTSTTRPVTMAQNREKGKRAIAAA